MEAGICRARKCCSDVDSGLQIVLKMVYAETFEERTDRWCLQSCSRHKE